MVTVFGSKKSLISASTVLMNRSAFFNVIPFCAEHCAAQSTIVAFLCSTYHLGSSKIGNRDLPSPALSR